MKPGYITVTRRQCSNQWNGGIAAHPETKQFRVQTFARKVFALIFCIKTASSSLITFQKPQYQYGVFRISSDAIEGYFVGNMWREVHQSSLVLARRCPVSLRTCVPQETYLIVLPKS